MKYTVILLFLFIIDASVNAQPKLGQARLDSLLAELPKMKEDSNGVKLMTNLAFEYCLIDPNEGLKWASRELALAQKINMWRGEVWAYNDLGVNYKSKGAYPEALEVYFKALHIYEEQGDKEGIGVESVNIGTIYYHQQDYPNALDWYGKGLKIAEERNDTTRICNVLGNIGIVYSVQGKNSEALACELKSLKLAEGLNRKSAILTATTNIAATYYDLKRYPDALAYFFKALYLARELGDKLVTATNLGNIGEVYYLIARDSSHTITPDSLVPATRAANLAKSIEYYNKGIAMGRQIDFKEGIWQFSGSLSDALALQGDYRGALAAYKVATAVKDSLYNIANSEKIATLETKRAVELKNKDIQIAKLKKRNERILFISGFTALLLITGILFRSFKKQQHSNYLLSKEKKRSDDLLLNILPSEVAEELKETGSAHARQYEDVSVLFTDFVGFTRTAQQLSAQTLVKELHECFTAFDVIIERNGLEKIKTIGDAYMAVCGLPQSDPLHAVKTVQAAIEISAFMEERKKRERAFEIRIGINSGPVVAGIVGVKKFAYDIWGDTVNTAARMEQHSEAGRINISQSTYELVKDDYRCDYRGKIAAKNKGEVAMYFVEATVAAIA